MRRYPYLCIDGRWLEPAQQNALAVINPATEEPIASVAAGSGTDVYAAVQSARISPGAFNLSSGEGAEVGDALSRVARRLRVGVVYINGAKLDPHAPFGGYSQSGNGREWGGHGFEVSPLEVFFIDLTGFSGTEQAFGAALALYLTR